MIKKELDLPHRNMTFWSSLARRDLHTASRRDPALANDAYGVSSQNSATSLSGVALFFGPSIAASGIITGWISNSNEITPPGDNKSPRRAVTRLRSAKNIRDSLKARLPRPSHRCP